MNNQGPIEFGGKVFEVKDGQVLTLNQPGLSLMLNVALAIKVWGTPNISLGAGSILSTFGNAVTSAVPSSAPNLSLPHISSAAIRILGAFGFGWWVRGLYDAREIAAGTNVRYINDS
jgi:hypothetical protein